MSHALFNFGYASSCLPFPPSWPFLSASPALSAADEDSCHHVRERSILCTCYLKVLRACCPDCACAETSKGLTVILLLKVIAVTMVKGISALSVSEAQFTIVTVLPMIRDICKWKSKTYAVVITDKPNKSRSGSPLL